MFPKETRPLLLDVARKVASDQYVYSNFDAQDKTFRFKAQAGIKVAEVRLAFPIDMNLSNSESLQSRVDSIVAEVANECPAVEWALPVRWSCPTDSEAFSRAQDSQQLEISGVGALLITSKKEALWFGITTPSVLDQLRELLKQKGIKLVENISCFGDEVPSVFIDTPANLKFLDDLESQDKILALPSFSSILGLQQRVLQKGKFSGYVSPLELPMDSIREGLVNFTGELNLAKLFQNNNPIIRFPEGFLTDLDPELCKLASNLGNLIRRSDFQVFKQLAQTFCQDAFFSVFSVLVRSKESVRVYCNKYSGVKALETHISILSAWVSKVIYDIFYFILHDRDLAYSVEQLSCLREILLEMVNSISNIALLKLRFKGVYNQLIRSLNDSQHDPVAVNNIKNFLSLLFQRDLPTECSLEKVLEFLGQCFREWSARLENLMPSLDFLSDSQQLSNAVLSFLQNIRNIQLPLYETAVIVTEILDRLAPRLSARDLPAAELLESIENLPLTAPAFAGGEEDGEYRWGLQILSGSLDSVPLSSLSSTHLEAGIAGAQSVVPSLVAIPENEEDQDQGRDVIAFVAAVDVMKDGEDLAAIAAAADAVAGRTIDDDKTSDFHPESLIADFSEIKGDHQFFVDVFRAAIVVAESRRLRSAPVLKTTEQQPQNEVTDEFTHAASSAVNKKSTDRVVRLDSSPAIGGPPEPKTAVVQRENIPTAVPSKQVVVKKSHSLPRAVLGILGLGLLFFGVAAVIIASHGVGSVAVGAAMPFMKAGVLSLMSYAGFGTTLAVASVGVAAGATVVVAAVPPTLRHRFVDSVKGLGQGLMNKIRGKGEGLSATQPKASSAQFGSTPAIIQGVIKGAAHNALAPDGKPVGFKFQISENDSETASMGPHRGASLRCEH